jgi:hypothetical protein
MLAAMFAQAAPAALIPDNIWDKLITYAAAGGPFAVILLLVIVYFVNKERERKDSLLIEMLESSVNALNRSSTAIERLTEAIEKRRRAPVKRRRARRRS